MARLTQKGRVTRALERTGKRGITQADFLGPDVIDGGAPITRLAARIMELKQDGIKIVDGGHRDGGCVIYQLAARLQPGPPVARPEPQPEIARVIEPVAVTTTAFRCLACGEPAGDETTGACPSCGADAVSCVLFPDAAAA